MPSRPTSCMKQRQTLTDKGMASSPVKAVAPVAVKADMASKYASVTLRSGKANSRGSAPKAGSTSQVRPTSRKPSRG